jgi:hypothetical protein
MAKAAHGKAQTQKAAHAYALAAEEDWALGQPFFSSRAVAPVPMRMGMGCELLPVRITSGNSAY